MKKIYFFSLLFMIGCSASSNKTENVFVIPINSENNELIPFSESGLKLSYELIPLYADTVSFYAPIPGAHLKVYKDCFYLFQSTDGGVRIFGKDGKFIKNIPNGRGPGEIEMQLSDLCFNEDTLLVYQMNKISFFDLKGNHIRDERKKENLMRTVDVYQFGDYHFLYSPDDFEKNLVQINNTKTKNVVAYAVSKNTIPKKEYTEFTLVDENGGRHQTKVKTSSLPLLQQMDNRFLECNENLYFNVPMSDCIFRVNKGDSIPYVYMKVGNLYSAENAGAMSDEARMEYLSKNKLFPQLYCLEVKDDGNLISFLLPTNGGNLKPLSAIYDKRENKLYELPITNFFACYPKGDFTYYVVAPENLKYMEEFFSEQEKEIVSGIEHGNEKIETYIIKVKIDR